MTTPLTPQNGPHVHHSVETPDDDHLPSYTDLFVVPSTCQENKRRRNTYAKN